VDRLYAIWAGDAALDGITLSEREETALSATLALKRPEQASAIISAQTLKMKNPDARRGFEFIAPALSPDLQIRDSFFASLSEERNRTTESWVLDGLSFLHHPLRTDHSERYVQRSLEMLEEIQATGDIFFPGRWMDQTLGTHTSPDVAETVRTFLAERPDYNAQLRLKILQAADPVFRASNLQTTVE